MNRVVPPVNDGVGHILIDKVNSVFESAQSALPHRVNTGDIKSLKDAAHGSINEILETKISN